MILDDLLYMIPSYVMSLLYAPSLILDYVWQYYVTPLYAIAYGAASVVDAFILFVNSLIGFVSWLPVGILAIIGLYFSTFVVLVVIRVITKIIGTLWPGQGWLE